MNKYKILYIEDEKNIRDTIYEIFRLQGYDISLASNGKEGLQALKEIKPDIIISDIMMEEMDGFGFIKELKLNKETELIPVIFLTAKTMVTEKLKGLELGADDYITKPFEFNELLLKVKNILNTRKKLLQRLYTEPEVIISESDEEVFLKELQLIIDQNISNPDLSLEEVANLLNYSISTLQRKLKKITGKSVSQFIREYRLKMARSLILSNHGNLAEIIRKTGFSSGSYFSHAYKNYFNISPNKDFTTRV